MPLFSSLMCSNSYEVWMSYCFCSCMVLRKFSLSSKKLFLAESSFYLSVSMCSEIRLISSDFSFIWMLEYWILRILSTLSRICSRGESLLPWNTFFVKYRWVIEQSCIINFGSWWFNYVLKNVELSIFFLSNGLISGSIDIYEFSFVGFLNRTFGW